MENLEQIWSIAEGQNEIGKPYILRFAEFYPTEEEQTLFCFLIEITWNYQEENSSGMPDQNLYDLMNYFEDVLEDEIIFQDQSIFVLTFIGNGKKIWQIYSIDANLFIEKLNEVMEGRKVLPIQIEVFQDKEWYGYKEFIELVQ